MIPRLPLGFLLAALLVSSLGATGTALTIDRPQSRLQVAVHSTVDSFTANLAGFDPVIAVDEQGNVTAARLTFHFRDLQTGKDKRDASMHKWQHTDAFPDGRFELRTLERNGAALTAVGELTFHGVSREIRFPVSVAHDGATYAIDADAPVDTRDFALPIIRMFGLLKVDPLVHVRIHVQGAMPAAQAVRP